MRSLLSFSVILAFLVTALPADTWAQAPSGALTRSVPATAQAAPRRGIVAKIKAGVRKLGVLGGTAAATLAATGAAYGMHRMGFSPAETSAAIATPILLGTGALAVLAQKAKGAWSRSSAALKLDAIGSAISRGKHGELPGIIQDLQREIAVEEASASATGGNAKASASKVAFLKLALARAEMGIDASDVATVRPNGATLSGWESHLQPLAAAAHAQTTATSEGKLALALEGMKVEISAELEVAKRHEATLATFLDHVPLAFGGAMSAQAKQTRQLLDQRRESEVEPEQALHGKLTTAMRGRVSNRMAAESKDFAQRRDRHAALKGLREGHVEPAYAAAKEAYDELTLAISDRSSEAAAEREAPEHRNDPDPNSTTGGTIDNSAIYVQRAASFAQSASTHTDNANAAMARLDSQLHALHDTQAFRAEQLPSPGRRVGRAQQGPSAAAEVFGNSMLNGITNSLSQMDLSSERSEMDGFMRNLTTLHNTVSQRENGEHRWLEGQIDTDLSRQMAAAR